MTSPCAHPVTWSYLVSFRKPLVVSSLVVVGFTIPRHVVHILAFMVDPGLLLVTVVCRRPCGVVTVFNPGPFSSCLWTTRIVSYQLRSWSVVYIRDPLRVRGVASTLLNCSLFIKMYNFTSLCDLVVDVPFILVVVLTLTSLLGLANHVFVFQFVMVF
jgi:hypothetical protein